jgi:hypothetical protein
MSKINSQDYYGIIMGNIRSLQNKEEKLYSDLNKYGISDTAKNKIVDDINKLSNERIELYNILENNSLFMQNLVETAKNDLKNEKITLEIIEDELSNIKDKYNGIKSGHINKLRMVEINTYYSKKYKAYGNLMKIIIMICVPVLILSILSNRDLLPSSITRGVSIFIILIGTFYIMTKMYDLYIRNNMNYDQYDFSFDANEQLKEDTGHTTNISQVLKNELKDIIDPAKKKLNIGCIGSECCGDDMTYDKQTNKCVDDKGSHKNSHKDSNKDGDKDDLTDSANESLFNRYKGNY